MYMTSEVTYTKCLGSMIYACVRNLASTTVNVGVIAGAILGLLKADCYNIHIYNWVTVIWPPFST